jgi:signal transduction histidine kinase
MSPYTIQTLFLFYSALSFSGAVLIGALFWKRHDLSAQLWMYGCLLTAVATVVTVHRQDIPLLISYSLMVSFEALSVVLMTESLKQLSPLAPDKRISRLAWLAPVGIFTFLELERYSAGGVLTPLMTAASSLVFGILNLGCLYHARNVGKKFTNSLFFNFLAVIFLVMSVLYFLRVINALVGYSGFAFDLKTYNLVIWFLMILAGSIRNLTYIVLRLHLGLTERGRLNNMNLRLSNILDERNDMILSLQKFNKSASINALASTIAHEINQPLTASKLNAKFTEMKLASDPGNISLLKEVNQSIISDIDRASEIVRNLSRLASNQDNEVSNVNVSDSINEVVEISKSKLRTSNIELIIQCEPDGLIKVNSSEWRQVLINLLNNAIEALVETDRQPREIRISVTRKKKTVMITIQDNGPGITRGKEAQIFEFLVSDKSSGTGIGLWISKNIIGRNGGLITAENASDGGACFTIELPSAS